MNVTKGLIHSIQSLAAVDGPGLRTVIVMQGCMLRCKFCHSIDTTLTDRGTVYSVDELIENIIKYSHYWGNDYSRYSNNPTGGVTITGGDPLMQPQFLKELLKELNKRNIHTVIETSLFSNIELIRSISSLVDLWIISIKHTDRTEHIKLTGKDNLQIIENINYLDTLISHSKLKSKIRIRFVVIPKLTDSKKIMHDLIKLLKTINNLEFFEPLPYVKLGIYKWESLFGKYSLSNISEASKFDVDKFKKFAISNKILTK
jgi:pyruvate formate lyase activating enzyme